MKLVFRTYNSLNATVFDLLSGDTEVKQTTAFAYLLAKERNSLQDFLNLEGIKRILGRISLDKYDKIVIHSELISTSNKRADIVIQLYKNNEPKIALIIEAKNAKINSSSRQIINQISGYLEPSEFFELSDFETFGCSLTKNDLIMHNPKVTAISWSSIFEMLNGKKGLAREYLEFISNINGTMKFYEKEVFSIPAGDSHRYQYNYPNIYECPNEGTRYTSMKRPLFMAFRKRFGIMERIFGVDDIIIMNPRNDYQSFMTNRAYSDDVKKRVTDYCNDFWGEGNYDDNEKQFFILSQTNQIELRHKPKPRRNNAFRAYYKLSDLLNAEKTIVEPEKD